MGDFFFFDFFLGWRWGCLLVKYVKQNNAVCFRRKRCGLPSTVVKGEIRCRGWAFILVWQRETTPENQCLASSLSYDLREIARRFLLQYHAHCSIRGQQFTYFLFWSSAVIGPEINSQSYKSHAVISDTLPYFMKLN